MSPIALRLLKVSKAVTNACEMMTIRNKVNAVATSISINVKASRFLIIHSNPVRGRKPPDSGFCSAVPIQVQSRNSSRPSLKDLGDTFQDDGHAGVRG